MKTVRDSAGQETRNRRGGSPSSLRQYRPVGHVIGDGVGATPPRPRGNRPAGHVVAYQTFLA
jgi:hypothetical protein